MRFEGAGTQLTPGSSIAEGWDEVQSTLLNQAQQIYDRLTSTQTPPAPPMQSGQMIAMGQTQQGNTQVQFDQNQALFQPNQPLTSQQAVIYQQDQAFSPFPNQNILGQQQQQANVLVQQQVQQQVQPEPNFFLQQQQVQQDTFGQQLQPQLQPQHQVPLQQSQVVTQMVPNMMQLPQQDINMGMMNPNLGPTSQPMVIQQPQFFQGVQNPVQLDAQSGFKQTVVTSGNQNINRMGAPRMAMRQQGPGRGRGFQGSNSQRQMSPSVRPNLQSTNKSFNQRQNIQSPQQQQKQAHTTVHKTQPNQSIVPNIKPKQKPPISGKSVENKQDTPKFKVPQGDDRRNRGRQEILPKVDDHRNADRQEILPKVDDRRNTGRQELNANRQRSKREQVTSRSSEPDVIIIEDDSEVSKSNSPARSDWKKGAPDVRARDSGSSRNDRFSSRTDRFGSPRFDRKEDSKDSSWESRARVDNKQRDEIHKTITPTKSKPSDIYQKYDNKQKVQDSSKDERNSSVVLKQGEKGKQLKAQEDNRVSGKSNTPTKVSHTEKPKSGSYIEIGDTKDIHKDTKRTESVSGNITIDLTPTDKTVKSVKGKQGTSIDQTGKQKEVNADKQAAKSTIPGKESTSALSTQSTSNKELVQTTTLSKPDTKGKHTDKVGVEGKSKIGKDITDTNKDIKRVTVSIKPEDKKEAVPLPKPGQNNLACTVTVDLVDISKEGKDESRQEKQKTDNMQRIELSCSPIKSTKLDNYTKATPAISTKADDKSAVSSRGKVSEEPTEQQKIQKLVEEINKNWKKEEQRAEEDNKSKDELLRLGSFEGDNPDEWAVTDEWVEEEAMDTMDVSASINDGIDCKTASDKTSKQDTKSAEQAPKVTVTVEMEIDDLSAAKKSAKGDQENQGDRSVGSAVKIGETSTDTKENFDKSKSVEKDNDQSEDDDDDFFDMSEFVTLDEEGEVDMEIGNMFEKNTSDSNTKIASDSESRQGKSSSTRSERSGDRESRSRSGKSRSSSKTRSTKDEKSGPSKSTRRDRSRSKDHSLKSESNRKSPGSSGRQVGYYPLCSHGFFPYILIQ